MATQRDKPVHLGTHAKLFRGLSDPARLSLLLRLRNGRCSAGALARDCGLSPSNASNHLQCLLDCGLVHIEARGRQNVYRLADRQVLRLLDASSRILNARAGALIDACQNYAVLSRRALRASATRPGNVRRTARRSASPSTRRRRQS